MSEEQTGKAWYESKPGHMSAMRIIAMMCAATGCIAVLSYIGGTFAGYTIDVQIAVVGGGMAGIGEVAKAWQAKGEK